LLERGRKRNTRENGVGHFEDLPTLQLGLGDIARKVRNLGTGGPSADQVQDRAAHYLLAASGVTAGRTLRDLNQFSTQAGVSIGGPALQAQDIDVDSYISNLHSQSTLALIQEGLEQSKRDFDIFLEDKVQLEWDEQRKQIYEHFGLARHSENILPTSNSASTFGTRGAFGRSTRKGKSAGLAGSSNNRASFGVSSNAPVLGSSISGHTRRGGVFQDPSDKSGFTQNGRPEDRFLRDKQEKFMGKVKELNVARLREISYPVLHSFLQVEAQSGSDTTQHLIDAYSTLISIIQEESNGQLVSGAPNVVKERCYSRLYLDENPESSNAVKMRKRILEGSRKFLEQQFLDQIESYLARNPREAQLGGVPSTLNKIRGYIRIKLAFKELGTDIEHLQRIGNDGDELPWVIVFYLLRAGLTTEAAQYVREKKNFFQNNDRNFQSAIAHYASDPDRRLSPDLQQKINHTFAQRARIAPTNDPYRMACYKIIGRCEMTRRNLEPLKESMEDWVWLQFNLARESNRAEENAGEVFGLEELRATIGDIGQRHFMSSSDAAGGYGVYFHLAILAGMFEQAVNFLYQHNYASAVHFAIALAYYGLLRVSSFIGTGSEILTFTARQQPQLDFARVVAHYTGDFRKGKPDVATDYLVLLCLNADLPGEAGVHQRDLCHEALRQLVLETREFAELLGDVTDNGDSTDGVIQRRLPLVRLGDQEGFLRTITKQAAKMADDTGRTTDAVLLYHLAGDYECVVSILNRALSEAISVDLGQEPLRLEPLKPRTDATTQSAAPSSSLSMVAIDDPVELSQKMINLYNGNPSYYSKILPQSRNTAGALLELNRAKKAIENGDWTRALDIINSTSILPLDANGALPTIRSSANNFAVFPPEIARNIGNVLMWTITCCGRHREHLMGGQFEDPTKRRLADQLLQSAKDLMVFAGLIRYKLPPRVFETLAKAGQDVGIY
jgi:nuclear pore complex protein Nup93